MGGGNGNKPYESCELDPQVCWMPQLQHYEKLLILNNCISFYSSCFKNDGTVTGKITYLPVTIHTKHDLYISIIVTD